MNKQGFGRTLVAAALSTTLLASSGCGYLLYPERQGQEGGRIDPVVAALDAAALLFYVVPGLVAFAVDFTNGTIYIPPGEDSALDKHISTDNPEQLKAEGWTAVPVEGELNSENVARALNANLDEDISATAIELMPRFDRVVLR